MARTVLTVSLSDQTIRNRFHEYGVSNRSFIGICAHSLAPGMAWWVFVQEHRTGMSATGPMFFPQINVGSDGTHVKDLKDSGDTVATNMAGLAVGQQRPWGHILQGHTDFHVLASDTMIAFRYRDEIFRPTVTSCWCSGVLGCQSVLAISGWRRYGWHSLTLTRPESNW